MDPNLVSLFLKRGNLDTNMHIPAAHPVNMKMFFFQAKERDLEQVLHS